MDIKETKEVLVAVNAVSVKLIELAKDGIDISDAVKLVADKDLRDKLVAAADGIAKVPEEIKDLSVSEGLELAQIQISYVPKIIDALNKK